MVIDMRLWHYKLIPVLPNQMLVSQWRECIAIKRQWQKGTLKHRLVSYVMDYNKKYFRNYAMLVAEEMTRRNIKYQEKLYIELIMFSSSECSLVSYNLNYPEHNNKYLKQCYYNLEEKHDRGIISDEEWKKVNAAWWEYQDRGFY